jgi:hypothetical protein
MFKFDPIRKTWPTLQFLDSLTLEYTSDMQRCDLNKTAVRGPAYRSSNSPSSEDIIKPLRTTSGEPDGLGYCQHESDRIDDTNIRGMDGELTGRGSDRGTGSLELFLSILSFFCPLLPPWGKGAFVC